MTTHRNSVLDRICGLLPGEKVWIESTADKYVGVMQKVSSRSRYPEHMREREYTCNAFTAVGAVGEVVILVRVTRTT